MRGKNAFGKMVNWEIGDKVMSRAVGRNEIPMLQSQNKSFADMYQTYGTIVGFEHTTYKGIIFLLINVKIDGSNSTILYPSMFLEKEGEDWEEPEVTTELPDFLFDDEDWSSKFRSRDKIFDDCV